MNAIYRSSSERELDHIIQKIILNAGEPPEGVVLRKDLKIQEFCLVVEASSKNTEALCYLATCYEELEKLQSGSRTYAPIQRDKSPKITLGFWERGRKLLKSLL